MRRTAGDSVRLFNGRDGEWRAVIRETAKRGARLEVLEGCGHLSTLEAPDRVNALLAAWLNAA